MNRYQAGSTLIELMISLVLSLVLIAGISSLFLQMQSSKDFHQAMSAMMEDSRYVNEILQKEIRRAGGLRSPMADGGNAISIFSKPLAVITLPTTGVQYEFNAGEYIKGDISNTPRPVNDSFVMRYQLIDAEDLSPDNPSNSASPCTANSILDPDDDPDLTPHVVRIYFFVTNGNLSCTSQRSIDNNPTKNTLLTDPPVTLISNVQKLLVLYGIDDDGDNAANYFIDAANLTPVTLWQQVVSVRLNLVLKSENTHLAKQIVPYTIEDTSYMPGDNSIYRVFSTTIALRNKFKGG